MKIKINNRILYTLFSIIVILSGTILAIKYASGSRISKSGTLTTTGLLSANSFPPGAQVYINDELITATDDTVNLKPDYYDIRIEKAGYAPWRKRLKIEKQHVTQTNAQLFPSASNLTALTLVGAENVSTSPDGQKIIYYTASTSAKEKNGLYLLDLTGNLNPLQKESKQITTDSDQINLTTAEFIWAPDSSEVMVVTEKKQIMVNIDKQNKINTLPNVKYQTETILSNWEEEMYLRERQYLTKFPDEIIRIATMSAKNVYISPDKKRVLYTATKEDKIPDSIIPPLPVSNTQTQTRNLKPGAIYVYDREEDKNFEIATDANNNNELFKLLLATDLDTKAKTLEASPSAFTKLQVEKDIIKTAKKFNAYHNSLKINTFQWFPDSKHILYSQDGEIKIMEYDGANKITIYSGPLAENFVYPWPDGSKLLIITSFSPGVPYNLYSINLK